MICWRLELRRDFLRRFVKLEVLWIPRLAVCRLVGLKSLGLSNPWGCVMLLRLLSFEFRVLRFTGFGIEGFGDFAFMVKVGID